MLSTEQWMRIAEAEAAAHYGRKHARLFMFRRFLVKPIGLLTLAGLAGLGAYLLWTHVHLPSVGSGPAHLPAAFWAFVILLGVGTFVAFRPGRVIPAAAILVRAIVISLLWLGVAAYGITVLI